MVALFGVHIANESSGGVDRDIVGLGDRGLEEVWCRLEGLANRASRHQLPKPFEDLRKKRWSVSELNYGFRSIKL